MKVPGLSGTWSDRLKTFGTQNFGGSYKGTYDQNISLYNKIKSGDYSTPAAPKVTEAQGPAQMTAFSDVLPYDKLFNQNLITGLAESQINPEIRRLHGADRGNLQRNLAQTGAFRSGAANQQRQGLADAYERQRKEQVEGFRGNINDMANTWYNQQSELYGKNPSGYVREALPTFDSFLKDNPGLSDQYDNITNVDNTYQSPFKY